jgi:hypothetical protein
VSSTCFPHIAQTPAILIAKLELVAKQLLIC